MKIGDLVTRKSYNNDITFCIIDFTTDADGQCVAVLKALYNNTIVVDAPVEDLENLLTKGKL
ncbi:sporulation peptidase YabG [Bacillota bacterium LX-D]|nr:sporulation peptidase YabG [Bacillota bacterium LX-D]